MTVQHCTLFSEINFQRSNRTPIILIVLHYFDLLTALTYILTAVAFFSDAIFGCRHFLKIRYQQENSGEQEMGQV